MRAAPALLVLLLALASTPALAQRGIGGRGGSLGGGQGSGGGRELLNACGVDLRAYCSGVQPGGGRIAQCIRQNWDKLSPACQKTILAARSSAPTPGATASAPAAASAPAGSAAPAMPAAPASSAPPPPTAASPQD